MNQIAELYLLFFFFHFVFVEIVFGPSAKQEQISRTIISNDEKLLFYLLHVDYLYSQAKGCCTALSVQ